MVFCKRDRKGTELAILTAASKLFAQKGYENTRTLDIAKEAGANEALIGRYFGGKAGLLEAVLHDQATSKPVILAGRDQCPNQELPTREKGMDFKEALKRFFKAGEIDLKNKEEFMRIGVSRSLVDCEMSKTIREQIIDKNLPHLADSLDQYLDGAKVTKKQKEAIAMLVASTNHHFNFNHRLIFEMDPEMIDLSFSILTESLQLYLESKGKK